MGVYMKRLFALILLLFLETLDARFIRLQIFENDNKKVALLSDWHKDGKSTSESQKQFLKILDSLDKYSHIKLDLLWELQFGYDGTINIGTGDTLKNSFISDYGHHLNKKRFSKISFINTDTQRNKILAFPKEYKYSSISHITNYVKKIISGQSPIEKKLKKLKSINASHYQKLKKSWDLFKQEIQKHADIILPLIKNNHMKTIGDLINMGINLEFLHFPEAIPNALSNLNIMEIEALTNILTSQNKALILYAGDYHCSQIEKVFNSYDFRKSYDSGNSYPTELDKNILNNLYQIIGIKIN